jgi:hypothetical protein
MWSEEIEVVAYAGYRDEESPRSFLLQGKKIEITRTITTWREEGTDRETIRCFKVMGSDGSTYTLCYHEQSMEWHLRGGVEHEQALKKYRLTDGNNS